jgi:hypothetical protein
VDPLDKLLLDVAYERKLRDAFAAKRKFEEAAESQGTVFSLTVKALLIAAGAGEAQPEEGQLVNTLTAALPENEALTQDFARLLEAFTSWRQEPDELLYPEVAEKSDAWLKTARRLCRTLQARRQNSTTTEQQVA